jgi:hypothetical protein
VLEGRMQRELHEEILDAREGSALSRACGASFPEAFAIKREEAGAGRDGDVELQNAAGPGIPEHPGVVGVADAVEARGLQNAETAQGIVEEEEIDVAHRPVGGRVVEQSENGGALQGQGAQALLQQRVLGSGGEVELNQPANGEAAPDLAKWRDCVRRVRSRGSLSEEARHSLRLGFLDERVGGLRGSEGRRGSSKQPLTKHRAGIVRHQIRRTVLDRADRVNDLTCARVAISYSSKIPVD